MNNRTIIKDNNNLNHNKVMINIKCMNLIKYQRKNQIKRVNINNHNTVNKVKKVNKKNNNKTVKKVNEKFN
jgi:hypothetical protein